MPAVLVHERHAHGDVDGAERFVGRVRRPRVGLAHALRALLRPVLPCVGAELSRLRHEVELPQQLARDDVERANSADRVRRANGVVAVNRRVADNEHVAHHHRRRARSDLAQNTHRAVGADLLDRVPPFTWLRFTIRRRVGDDERTAVVDRELLHGIAEAFHEIDFALLAEERIGLARLRVERHEVIPRGRHEQALLAAAVPVGEPASRKLTRRLLPADPFFHPIRPQLLPRFRVDRHHVTLGARHREQSAVRIQRRRAVVLVGPELLAALPLPAHLQLGEVVGIDLIERRITRAPLVGAPVAPLPIGVAARHRRGLGRLRGHGGRRQGESRTGGTEGDGRPAKSTASDHGFSLRARKRES